MSLGNVEVVLASLSWEAGRFYTSLYPWKAACNVNAAWVSYKTDSYDRDRAMYSGKELVRRDRTTMETRLDCRIPRLLIKYCSFLGGGELSVLVTSRKSSELICQTKVTQCFSEAVLRVVNVFHVFSLLIVFVLFILVPQKSCILFEVNVFENHLNGKTKL